VTPRLLLRLEGLALFGAALAVYLEQDYNLWLALVLILAPDLGLLGYLAGPRIGAYAYDSLHTTIVPLALGGAAFVGDWTLGIEIALIWLAHIGVDRAVGYGLKYAAAPKPTHLQRV
jgi:hypothetical protein